MMPGVAAYARRFAVVPFLIFGCASRPTEPPRPQEMPASAAPALPETEALTGAHPSATPAPSAAPPAPSMHHHHGLRPSEQVLGSGVAPGRDEQSDGRTVAQGS